MKFNEDFLEYIYPYLVKLEKLIGSDFVVFGSTPLYLYGVAEFSGKINDLDVSLRTEKSIPKEAKVVTFHKDKKQLFYKIKIDDLEIDMSSNWSGYEKYFEKIHLNPVTVRGFKFANLDIIKEWKELMFQKYNREKDKNYLDRINDYLDKNKIC